MAYNFLYGITEGIYGAHIVTLFNIFINIDVIDHYNKVAHNHAFHSLVFNYIFYCIKFIDLIYTKNSLIDFHICKLCLQLPNNHIYGLAYIIPYIYDHKLIIFYIPINKMEFPISNLFIIFLIFLWLIFYHKNIFHFP